MKNELKPPFINEIQEKPQMFKNFIKFYPELILILIAIGICWFYYIIVIDTIKQGEAYRNRPKYSYHITMNNFFDEECNFYQVIPLFSSFGKPHYRLIMWKSDTTNNPPDCDVSVTQYFVEKIN